MSNPKNPDPVFSRPDPSGSPLPADPLLRNGTFIDATAQPSVVLNTEASPQPSSVASVNNASQSATQAKSRRKVPVTMASPPSDATSWLPPGWMVEDRIRTNGATAGTMDRYYIEPVTNRRFRSKKEVQYYLETGELLKNKRKNEASNLKPDVNSPENSNKKANKKLKWPEMTFDHKNVPEMIAWVLTNAEEDVWDPFIGSEKVSEYIKQNWEFEMLRLNQGRKKW